MEMRRALMLPVGGLVLGVIGAGLVFAYVRGVEADAHAAGETVTVYVARDTVAAGTPAAALAPKVKATEMPRRFVPRDAVGDLDAVEGHLSLARLDPGDLLRERDFGAAGTTRGQLAIPEGKEAVAVAVTLDGGVARYPAPGDHVNVYATFRSGSGVTRRILADVEVLATEPRSGSSSGVLGAPGSNGRLVYLLAVTPDEAGRLVFGRELGSLWLTLVPQGQPSAPVADVTMDLPSLPGPVAGSGRGS